MSEDGVDFTEVLVAEVNGVSECAACSEESDADVRVAFDVCDLEDYVIEVIVAGTVDITAWEYVLAGDDPGTFFRSRDDDIIVVVIIRVNRWYYRVIGAGDITL